MSAKKKLQLPVDPDARVPAAVRAAAERASQIHEHFYKKPEGEGGEPPADPTTVADPVAPPAADPAAPPAPPPAAPAPTQPVDWEAKYNQMLSSMNGRVEREKNISRSLGERIAQLEDTLASLQSAPPAPAAAVSLVKPDEITEYGADFLDVVGRKASEIVTPEVAALKQQVDELKQQLRGVGQHVSKTARERMHDMLDQQLPNWTEINDNEKFLDWLALPDPYSGTIKHNLLKAAYAANDAPRVLNFFKGFLASEAATVPPAPQPDPAPQPEPKVPLENLAAPGRAKTAAPPPAPVEKPIINSADVRKFYEDLARGAYRGRDDEKNSIEKMIFEANRDGRIR